MYCIGICFNHGFHRYVGAEPAHLNKTLSRIHLWSKGPVVVSRRVTRRRRGGARPGPYCCCFAICYIMVRHGAAV